MITFKEWFSEKYGVIPSDYYKSYMSMCTLDIIHRLNNDLFKPLGVNNFEINFMKELDANVFKFMYTMAFSEKPASVLPLDKLRSVQAKLHAFIRQDIDVLFGIAKANDLFDPVLLKYGMKITDMENNPCIISRCCTSFNDMVYYCFVHDKLRGTKMSNDYSMVYDDLKTKGLSYDDRLKILQSYIEDVS